MAVVAIVAAVFAAARAGGPQGVGIVIILICIGCLSYARYSLAVSQMAANGLTTGSWRKTRILSTSVFAAMAIIVSSDLAFICVLQAYRGVTSSLMAESHWTPRNDPVIAAPGVILGALLALRVARCLIEVMGVASFRRPRSARGRVALWAIGVSMLIGGLWIGRQAWERYSFCRMMTEYHARAQVEAEDWKKAARHAWLSRWYGRAAIRPWLPVHPDRLPEALR